MTMCFCEGFRENCVIMAGMFQPGSMCKPMVTQVLGKLLQAPMGGCNWERTYNALAQGIGMGCNIQERTNLFGDFNQEFVTHEFDTRLDPYNVVLSWVSDPKSDMLKWIKSKIQELKKLYCFTTY